MWICRWVQVLFTIIPQNRMSTRWCTKILLFYRHLFVRRMWKWVMNSYWIMGQHIGRPHGVACQRVTPTLRDRMLLRKKAACQNRKKWFKKCLAKVEGHVCCWPLGNIWTSWCFVMTLQFEMEMESLKLDKCNHIAHLHLAHSWFWDAARTNPDKASWFAKRFFVAFERDWNSRTDQWNTIAPYIHQELVLPKPKL